MAELTTSGFERRNRTQILEDVRSRFRNKFGQNINLDDDSVMGKLAVMAAELELEYEKLAEEQHFSQTIGGAEGIYLDDLLSKYGVFRRGKVAGAGTAHILYTVPSDANGNSSDNITVATSATINAENGRTYSPIENTVLKNNTTGLLIERSALVTGYTYQVDLVDTNGDTQVDSWNYDGTDNSALNFFNGLANFIAQHTDNAVGTNIIVDGTAGSEVLYAGYSQASADTSNFIGFETPLAIGFSKAAGRRWSAVDVECNTKGFFPVPRRTVTGMSPEPSGFDTITNVTDFDPGANTETDAEFKNRYFDVISSGSSGTKDGIITALRNLDGVDNVRVYDNPREEWLEQDGSGNFNFVPSPTGDTVVAEPLTFNSVVNGGVANDIALALYNNKPINVKTSEEPSQAVLAGAVATADGTTENIYYTPASDKALEIQITYISGDGIPLSSSEITTIKSNIQSVFNDFDIGDIVYNTQVVSATLSSLTFDRVKNISVKIAAVGNIGNVNAGDDYTDLAYNEVAVVDDTDISIIRGTP